MMIIIIIVILLIRNNNDNNNNDNNNICVYVHVYMHYMCIYIYICVYIYIYIYIYTCRAHDRRRRCTTTGSTCLPGPATRSRYSIAVLAHSPTHPPKPLTHPIAHPSTQTTHSPTHSPQPVTQSLPRSLPRRCPHARGANFGGPSRPQRRIRTNFIFLIKMNSVCCFDKDLKTGPVSAFLVFFPRPGLPWRRSCRPSGRTGGAPGRSLHNINM